MKQNRHHFFLGVFVLSAVALAGTAITLLGAQTLWEDYVIMETYINESVSGLDRGSAVKFRGITVGKVEEITTVSQKYPTTKTYAYVKIKVFANSIPARTNGETIGEEVRDRVGKGLRVALASSGVIGDTYIDAEYLEDSDKISQPEIDWTPTEIYIPSVPSTLIRFKDSLDTVLRNLAKTDIPGVVSAARDTLRKVELSLNEIDLPRLSAEARSFLDRTGRAAESAGRDLDTLAAEISSTLKDVRLRLDATLGNADQTLRNLDQTLVKSDLDGTLGRLSAVLDEARVALESIRGLAGRVDQTLVGVGQIVRGRSRGLGASMESLREILDNLNALTGTLRAYPSLLFVGNAPKPVSPHVTGGKATEKDQDR